MGNSIEMKTEVDEVLKKICNLIEVSIKELHNEGVTGKERSMLVHYKEKSLEEAMSLAKVKYPNYHIKYEIRPNTGLTLLLESK